MTSTTERLTRLASRRLLLVAVLCLALVGGAAATTGAAAAAASAPFCGITWGSLPKSAGEPTPAPLLDVRTGQHPCYDRVVFDFGPALFGGGASGYTVQYADSVSSQGGLGQVLDVAGGAKLAVVLREPSSGETGAAPYPHAVGDHVANVAGYRTLRDVVYGGGFEGSTTFGVGVRARLPFRVFTLAGPGGQSRIVLDVAHRWSA